VFQTEFISKHLPVSHNTLRFGVSVPRKHAVLELLGL